LHDTPESTADLTRRGPRRQTTRVAIAAGTVAVLAGCADDAPQDTWQPAGPNAQLIHDLQWPVFLTAGIVGVIVIVVLIYIVIRFRDRGQPIPKQTHGKPALEITLTAIPAVIMAVIAGFTVPAVMALAKSSDTECVVNVTGQQWWWEYDYPVSEDGTICGVAPTSAEAHG
jgi:cytochrome c oxidase subunit 2